MKYGMSHGDHRSLWVWQVNQYMTGQSAFTPIDICWWRLSAYAFVLNAATSILKHNHDMELKSTFLFQFYISVKLILWQANVLVTRLLLPPCCSTNKHSTSHVVTIILAAFTFQRRFWYPL